MQPPPGDRITIRINGDATGPVVAGRDNRVEVERPPDENPAGAAERQAAGPTQTNTANDHGTLFTVMHGDLHVHHDTGPHAGGHRDGGQQGGGQQGNGPQGGGQQGDGAEASAER
ncbi:hypothetical protein OG455_01525 [Kitasatospora sp. NBC_01287]|uniref:hypothetical protein n=1 Tax=Kitasatospora sp. NBC_01287 TaxID=2903573 RepID=UPI00224E1633|nr:hypothetical protein [Kitasatospora sp. NBC_01287]MCX4744205.1 hypothetical protein [Kitasatospora sp. NBC_01287]